MSQRGKGFYTFGDYRVDPTERALYGRDDLIQLTPKAFDTLLALVERAGHVVSKEELMQAVWPDTFVEEGNLNGNIFALRRALGESNGHKFIETVPRRGYRFLLPVKLVIEEPEPIIERHTRASIVAEEEDDEATAILPLAGEASAKALAPAKAARGREILAGIACVVVLAAAAAYWLIPRPGRPVRVSLAGDRLMAWDVRGKLAWQYALPEPAELNAVQGSEGAEFQDLQGDGRQDLLLVLNLLPQAPQASSPMPLDSVLFRRTKVFCFSEKGKMLWSYSPDDVKLSFAGRVFEGPW